MALERTRHREDAARDADTQSAREALEHPRMLFRFQRDPLDAAMHAGLAQAGARSAARRPPKQRAKSS